MIIILCTIRMNQCHVLTFSANIQTNVTNTKLYQLAYKSPYTGTRPLSFYSWHLIESSPLSVQLMPSIDVLHVAIASPFQEFPVFTSFSCSRSFLLSPAFLGPTFWACPLQLLSDFDVRYLYSFISSLAVYTLHIKVLSKHIYIAMRYLCLLSMIHAHEEIVIPLNDTRLFISTKDRR